MQKHIQKLTIVLSFCGLFFAFPLLTSTAQLAMSAEATLTCQPPSVSVTNQGDSFVTFSVSTPANSFEYNYVRTDNNASSGTMSVSGSTVTINGLTPGVYRFYFKSICTGSETSDYVISELIIG